MIAVVAFYDKLPVVLGFLYPQVNQMCFGDGRRITRHASDVYTTIDDQGNTELYHPSGTFLRIGTAPAHEDLTGLDEDGKWKIDKNTDKAVYLHLEVANAGVKKFSLDIDPSGNVTIDTRGTLSVHADGDLSLDTDGDMSLVAGGGITATAGLAFAISSILNTSVVSGTTVDITSAGNTNVTAPVLQASAAIGGVNVNATGNVTDGVRSMAADRGIYNGHDHPGDSGGTTGVPNQAQ